MRGQVSPRNSDWIPLSGASQQAWFEENKLFSRFLRQYFESSTRKYKVTAKVFPAVIEIIVPNILGSRHWPFRVTWCHATLVIFLMNIFRSPIGSHHLRSAAVLISMSCFCILSTSAAEQSQRYFVAHFQSGINRRVKVAKGQSVICVGEDILPATLKKIMRSWLTLRYVWKAQQIDVHCTRRSSSMLVQETQPSQTNRASTDAVNLGGGVNNDNWWKNFKWHRWKDVSTVV